MQLFTVTDEWVSLSTASEVTFQVTSGQSNSRLFVIAEDNEPTEGSLLGFFYKAGEGELAKSLTAFGSGSTLWARTDHGTVGVTLHELS